MSKRRRRGMLTVEWILMITVVVIGIVGGLACVRNAILTELHDLAGAITALNITDSNNNNNP
ncbi:MAG: hypothetical protein K8T91_26190 [Planctomycetes bacterium]|nr:hypothetical protein [Planctomycetota bacterium]